MVEVTKTARAMQSVAALQTRIISMIERRYRNTVEPIITMHVSIGLQACSSDKTKSVCAGAETPSDENITGGEACFTYQSPARYVSSQMAIPKPTTQALGSVPRLLTLPKLTPPPTNPTRKHHEPTGICPEITLDTSHAESSTTASQSPRDMRSPKYRHPRHVADAMVSRQIPISVVCPMWAHVSIASVLETRDSGTGKVGLEPARQMWQGFSRLGNRILFPPTRWAGCYV
jgi:hypothetical protein